MPSIRLEDLTPLGRLALKLDQEFVELTRLGGQIAEVDLQSDNGLDQGVKILNRVAEYGQSAAETMLEFSKALQETREKAEAATKLAADRSQIIQERRQRQDELIEKLEKIKDDVGAFGTGLAGINQPRSGEPTEEDKRKLAAELERVQASIAGFVAAIDAIKTEAAGANFKRVARHAESMIDSLQATRRKIVSALGEKPA